MTSSYKGNGFDVHDVADSDSAASCMTGHLQSFAAGPIPLVGNFVSGVSTLPDVSRMVESEPCVAIETSCTAASAADYEAALGTLRGALVRRKFTQASWRAVARCDQVHFVPVLGPSRQVEDLWARQLGYAQQYLDMIRDVAQTRKKTDLHEKYPHEYNSHRSRRQAARASHTYFDVSLRDFREWLVHLGPQPEKHWTVDNISGTQAQGYRPGNVRWACKRLQRHNQGRVRRGRLSLPDGRRVTIGELARMANLRPNTVSKRLARGWPIERILLDSPSYSSTWTFPYELMCLEPEYRKRRNKQQSRLEWAMGYVERQITSRMFWLYQDESRKEDLYQLLESLGATYDELGIEEQRRQAAAGLAILEGAKAYLTQIGGPAVANGDKK